MRSNVKIYRYMYILEFWYPEKFRLVYDIFRCQKTIQNHKFSQIAKKTEA